MSKVEDHRRALRQLGEWEPYLLEHSNLPGPRANLELVAAAVEEGDTARFLALLERAPAGEHAGGREEFLAVCGAAGLGRSIADGEAEHWPRLRALASDPRWRVREGVAMALQRIGDAAPERLLDGVEDWVAGGALERRAVVAGLCEPRLLRDEAFATATLAILDRLTADLEAATLDADGRVLRQALGYGWSVAVVASPAAGRRRFEEWAESADPDVRWVVRQNLKKKRLQRLDPDWVATLRERAG